MAQNNSRKHQRLDEVLVSAERLKFDNQSRLILFSDIHRGDNSWADEFSVNQTIYAYALEYYFRNGFTYIEVGDGDELMKNINTRRIRHAHRKIYQILRDFFLEGRFYYIYGNHDILYKSREYVAENLFTMNGRIGSEAELLFPGIKVHEGLLLEHEISDGTILVTHGHQGEFIHDRFWRLSRFLLRHLWRPLQMIGIQNPYRVSYNPQIRRDIENQLMDWSREHQQPILCGHTHCARIPEPGKVAYFNTGSCVHPQWISGIEIDQGYVMLIRWRIMPDQLGQLLIQREVIAGPEDLSDLIQPYQEKYTDPEDLTMPLFVDSAINKQ